jgi:hypothetical protein
VADQNPAAEAGQPADVQRLEIDAQYERAYAGVEDPLGEEFEGWEEQGVFPPVEPPRTPDS